MKLALLGSRGQLGRQLAAILPGTVIALDRPTVDLAHLPSIPLALRPLRPDWVINCAAYNFVDRAVAEPEQAFAVNALGVRELARCCANLDSCLVHFSSDHVFGQAAARTLPYREIDEPGPVNIYGESKLAGEGYVRAICPRHLIIRTCGLYGKHSTSGKGTNFVDAILHQARAGTRLKVVHDQRCTPTSAADLAQAVASLIAARHQGMVHVTSAGACSWFEFAEAIVRDSGLAGAVIPITSAEYGAAARRPGFSVLDCTAYDALGVAARRPWQVALRDYLRTCGK